MGIHPPIRQLLLLISFLLMLEAVEGCSTPKITGRWKHTEIIANGISNEWTGEALLVDDDEQMKIRVVSDNQSLALCIETGTGGLKRQPQMDGLTMWIDPNGGKEKIFGIHVRSGPPMDRGRKPPADAGNAPPTEKADQPRGQQVQHPHLEPIEQAAITYSDATGPLTMAMDEIRRTGIDIGVGRGAGRSMVYEFNIAFKAAPSLESLAPGMTVGLGIMRGGADPGDRKPAGTDDGTRQDGPPGGGGGPGPGGSMGRPGAMMDSAPMAGGHGGPPGGARQNDSGVWLQVQLAGGGQG